MSEQVWQPDLAQSPVNFAGNEDGTRVEFIVVANISTSHVSWSDWCLLMEDEDRDLSEECSPMINLHGVMKDKDRFVQRGYSEGFAELLERVALLKFHYVRFDADARVVHAWETFDW
jgi:hypothetical protein